MLPAEAMMASLLLLSGGAFFVGSVQLPYHFRGVLGPGFVPLWLSVGLFLVSAAQAWCLRKGIVREAGSRWARPLLVWAVVAVTAGLSYLVGIPVALGAFMLLYLRYFDHKTWGQALKVAILLPLITMLLFEHMFGIKLYLGLFE